MIKSLIDKVSNTKAPPGSVLGGAMPLSPEIGAAGLLLHIAKRDGSYTEIEKDLIIGALMKLFHVLRPAALDHLHAAEEAEQEGVTISQKASAARDLPLEQKEMLLTRLWAMIDGDDKKTSDQMELMRVIADILGMGQERAKSLRLPIAKENG